MFFRKKLYVARSNFIMAYRGLKDEIANVKSINKCHSETIYLEKIYEEVIFNTNNLADDVMRYKSVKKIEFITAMIISYKDILHHVYNYYCDVNNVTN